MDLNERIKLEKQTVETLERIRDNGGNVPDGYVLEFTDDKNWQHGQYPVSDHEGAWWFRLTPIKPPRFTVSTDPCGVLDSEWPGCIAGCSTPIVAARYADDLNSGKDCVASCTWSQLPKPQIPLGPEDVPPGSVFRQKDWPLWKYIPGYPQCSGKGLMMAGSYFAWESLVADWEILRHGFTEWQPCSKDAT